MIKVPKRDIQICIFSVNLVLAGEILSATFNMMLFFWSEISAMEGPNFVCVQKLLEPDMKLLNFVHTWLKIKQQSNTV